MVAVLNEAAFICLAVASRGRGGTKVYNVCFVAGGPARGEQETPSWRNESWYRHYTREKTTGGAETPDGRTSEVRRSES